MRIAVRAVAIAAILVLVIGLAWMQQRQARQPITQAGRPPTAPTPRKTPSPAAFFRSAVGRKSSPATSDPVRIESIHLSSNVARPGDTIIGRVNATRNAVSVTAQAGTYTVQVPKIAPGEFSLTVHVPSMIFMLGKIDILVKASRADGASDERMVTVPVEH